MVVLSERISWRTKGFLAMSTAAWLTLPISTLNLYLSQQFPFSLGIVLDFGLGFLGAMGLFSYGYGYLKQHQASGEYPGNSMRLNALKFPIY